MSNLGCKFWCVKTHLWISNASGNWSVDLQVSILAGTLARLDRDAPHYKKYFCFTDHVFIVLFISQHENFFGVT